MNAERMKILKMLEEGKLSVEDASRLIQAVESSQEAETGSAPKWLRIRVHEGGVEKVKVDLPVSLMKIAMKFVPEDSKRRMEEEGIHLDQVLKQVQAGSGGKLVEVTDGDQQVEIYVE